MDFISQAVTLKKFGHLKAKVVDYHTIDDMYKVKVYGWSLANGTSVHVYAKKQDLATIKPPVTIGEEVTLVFGNLNGLVRNFRPFDDIYCIEILDSNDTKQQSSYIYCKKDAIHYEDGDDYGEDQDDDGMDVDADASRSNYTAYDAYVESFFKNMESKNNTNDNNTNINNKNNNSKKRKLLSSAVTHTQGSSGNNTISTTTKNSKKQKYNPPQQFAIGYKYLKKSFKDKGYRSFLKQVPSDDGNPVLGLKDANVIILGTQNIDPNFITALIEDEKINVVKLGETDRIDLVVHPSFSKFFFSLCPN